MISAQRIWQGARAGLGALLFVSALGVGAAAHAQAALDGGSAGVRSRAMVSARETAQLFDQRCSGCHGDDGSGPIRPRPTTHIPNLREAKWQAAHSDAQIRAIIADGVPGKHMPAFKDRLTVEQIAQLATFVRGLAK